MSKLNYELDSYSWKSVLLWGASFDHFKKAKGSNGKNKIIHLTIAAIELIPILGQIASLFEWAIVRAFQVKKNENVDRWADVPDILSNCEYLYKNKHLHTLKEFRYFVCSNEFLNNKDGFSNLSNYVNDSLSEICPFFLSLLLDEQYHNIAKRCILVLVGNLQEKRFGKIW